MKSKIKYPIALVIYLALWVVFSTLFSEIFYALLSLASFGSVNPNPEDWFRGLASLLATGPARDTLWIIPYGIVHLVLLRLVDMRSGGVTTRPIRLSLLIGIMLGLAQGIMLLIFSAWQYLSLIDVLAAVIATVASGIFVGFYWGRVSTPLK